MKYKKPFISVIIPVYNSEKFINEAFESVFISIKKYPHEIIAINDGSTDKSLEVLKKWSKKIKIFSQKNKGASAARNFGIKSAKGEYLAFIDADDIWTNDHIEVLLKEFNKNNNLEISMGYSQRIQKDKSYIGEPVLLPTFGSAIIKCTVFDKIGLIDERYAIHEDLDWYLRAREKKTNISVVKKTVNYYRLHENNTTNPLKSDGKRVLHVIAESLFRRGKQNIKSLEDFINE